MNFSQKSLAYYFEEKDYKDSNDYRKAIECYYKAFEESRGQKDSVMVHASLTYKL